MVTQILASGAGGDARVSVTFAAAVFGLVIGSFLNVVVYRVPRGLSVVQPGSFCPACGTPIRSSDNVPVLSWLVLRAKCRHCGEPISPRYPAVELLTGTIFGAVAWALGAHWAVPGMCALSATVLALATVELDGLAPPATVSLIGTGMGALLLSAAAIADRRWWHLGGLWIGTGAALCVVVAGSWAAKRRATRVTLWALIPAGAVLGWVGPLGAGVGAAAAALTLVGLSLLREIRRRHDGPRRNFGVAIATAVGVGAALIAAFVSGNSIGL